uniref:Uncharacterized protein n=1 Tax=Caenorhabditis japonica TaxID=281687 RepID=A0A8R1IKK7_CAEJA
MNWDFSEVPYNQSKMYEQLYWYWNAGKTPIYFPATNASANYSSSNWMESCYERFYEMGGKFVVYWLVNGDMYCEVVVIGSHSHYTPSFEQKYLFRGEYKYTWCLLNN